MRSRSSSRAPFRVSRFTSFAASEGRECAHVRDRCEPDGKSVLGRALTLGVLFLAKAEHRRVITRKPDVG